MPGPPPTRGSRDLEARLAEAERAPPGRPWRPSWPSCARAVRSEKLGEVAAEFDSVHSIHRAVSVGSVDAVIAAEELRPQIIAAIEAGLGAEPWPGAASGQRHAGVAGLLLAAGAGRRMGGPKALVAASGGRRPARPRRSRVLREAGCDPVVVVLGAGADECPRRWPAAADARRRWPRTGPTARAPRCGPGSTRCRRHRRRVAVVVLLVDLPDVGAAVLARVLAARGGRRGRQVLARAAYDGMPGHPVLLGRDHWAGDPRPCDR